MNEPTPTPAKQTTESELHEVGRQLIARAEQLGLDHYEAGYSFPRPSEDSPVSELQFHRPADAHDRTTFTHRRSDTLTDLSTETSISIHPADGLDIEVTAYDKSHHQISYRGVRLIQADASHPAKLLATTKNRLNHHSATQEDGPLKSQTLYAAEAELSRLNGLLDAFELVAAR